MGLLSWLRTRRLRPDMRAVKRERLTYLSDEKLIRLKRAIDEVERRRVSGDILEFGVALGGSGIVLAALARDGRRFHGYDVFGMIPPPTSSKDDDKSRARYKVIESGGSSGLGQDEYYGYRQDLIGDVKASFARYGRPVDGTSILLHQGLFEDTWRNSGVRKVALAHIDCDWYDPVKFCLEAIANIVSIGGVIIIDDYHDYGGCKVAVDEFIEANSGYSFEDGANPILRKLGL